MSINVGDLPTLTYALTVAGVPTAATVTLTLTAPDGTTSTPAVTASATVGTYTATALMSQAGTWAYRWVASGAATDVETGLFEVTTSSVVNLQDVKDRLNKSLKVDDLEMSDMIDKAVVEYAEWVGPVEARTVRLDGGRGRLILPRNTAAVTAVAYTDGTVVNVADLDLDVEAGLLGWGYNTAGYFTRGTRNVLVTVRVRVPANHREAIIADVAGYFAATQRGGGQGPSFSSEGYELAGALTPMVLFPRIRALAASYPTVA